MNKCPFCKLVHDPTKTNCNDPKTGALIRRAGPLPAGVTTTPPQPKTRIQLDIIMAGSKCTDPNCKCGGKDPVKEILVACHCNPSSGLVLLRYSDGVLNVSCPHCGMGIDRFAVA